MELPVVLNKKAELKYFHILSCAYVLMLTSSITMVARLISVNIPFTSRHIILSGATIVMPLAFFIQDIITEVYGYIKSRQLVQIAILLLIIYVFGSRLISTLPSPSLTNEAANINDVYSHLYNTLPKHLIGLILAVFIGSFINDYLVSKSKIILGGRFLGIRFITATSIGEIFYQVIGMIVWSGTLQFSTELIPFILFSYLYKILFEIMTTPFNYMVCSFLKKSENIDIYDHDVNYNPFIW